MKTQIKEIKKGNITGVILIVITLLLIAASIICYKYIDNIFKQELIRENVYIDNVYVGKLTREQASDKVFAYNREKYDSISINFIWEQYENSFTLSDSAYTYDNSAAIDKAYLLGRTGNILEKLNRYFFKTSPVYYSSVTSYDESKVKYIIHNIASDINQKIDHSNINVLTDRVIVHKGQPSYTVNENKLFKDITTHIIALDATPITIAVISRNPFTITSKRIFDLVYKPAVDAAYIYTDNEVSVSSEIYGKTIDKEYIEESLLKYSDFTIDIEAIKPSLYARVLKEKLFRDELSSFISTFSTATQNSYNRSINIALASSEINDLILAPGETFSFNEVVGERTEQRGYQIAHVYSNGEVIDGIGGGICQVSSTLYNATLFADLEIVDRGSHQFTVGYVPLGRDATVSYGYKDYAFANNTPYPIKVEVIIKDIKIDEDDEYEVVKAQTIQFNIVGTNEHKDITYDYHYNMIEERPYLTTIQYDESKAVDFIEVIQYGKYGYAVETIKETYVDGEKIKEESLNYSYYRPYPQIEIHGGVDPADSNSISDN